MVLGYFSKAVRMDWFNLFMSTDLKVSEFYLLIRNSILKSSIKEIQENKQDLLRKVKNDIIKFFHSEKIKNIINNYHEINKHSSIKNFLNITKQEKIIKTEMVKEKNTILEHNLKKNCDRIKKKE
jgi:hypothetical protein